MQGGGPILQRSAKVGEEVEASRVGVDLTVFGLHIDRTCRRTLKIDYPCGLHVFVGVIDRPLAYQQVCRPYVTVEQGTHRRATCCGGGVSVGIGQLYRIDIRR